MDTGFYFFFKKTNKKVKCILFANCINFKSKFCWKRAPGCQEPQTAQVILCPNKCLPISLSDDLEFKYYGYLDLKIEYRLSTFPVSVIVTFLVASPS